MKTHKEVKSTAKGKDFGVGSPRAARVNTNLNSPRIKVPVSPKDVQTPKTGAYMNSKLTSPKVDNPIGSQSQIFPHKTTSPNHSLFLPIKNNHRKRWEQFQQQDIAKFQSHRWRRMNLEWVPLETIFIQNPLEIREALINQPLPVAKNAQGSKKENLNSFKRSNSWNPSSCKKPRINRVKYPS